MCSAHIVLWNVDRWTHRAASLNQTPPRQHTLSIPSWHQEGFCRFFNICRSLQTAALAKFPHQSQVELMRVIAQPLNQIQGFNISWMLDKSWALWWFIPQVKCEMLRFANIEFINRLYLWNVSNLNGQNFHPLLSVHACLKVQQFVLFMRKKGTKSLQLIGSAVSFVSFKYTENKLYLIISSWIIICDNFFLYQSSLLLVICGVFFSVTCLLIIKLDKNPFFHFMYCIAILISRILFLFDLEFCFAERNICLKKKGRQNTKKQTSIL